MSGVSNSWSSHWGTNDPTTDAVKQYWHVGATRWNEDSTSAIICWQCTASGYPGTWIARYAGYGGDSIPRVANVAALTAIDTSAYLSSQMHLAEVVTLGDSFRYIPSGGRGTYSAATAYAVDDFVVYLGLSYRCRAASTGNTPPVPPAAATTFWEVRYDIVACATGTGTWSRNLNGDKRFIALARLSATAKTPEGVYVNAATGNDENTGLSSGSPLSSVAEIGRRLSGIVDISTLNIYVTGTTAQTFDFSAFKISAIRIIGTPTVLTSTTLNGAADLVAGVSPTVGYVTSASLDFHGGGLASTTTRSTFIRRDNGDGSFTYAAIQRTDSGTPLRAKITKQCKLTPGNAANWTFEHEPTSGFFASGQSVDVVSFPIIGSIVAPAGTIASAYLLDASGATGSVSFRMCGFTSGFANSVSAGFVQALGGIIQCSSTITVTGSTSQIISMGIGCSSGSTGSLNVRFCDLQNLLYITLDDATLSLTNCNARMTAIVAVNNTSYAIIATQSLILFDINDGFCCDSTVAKIILCDRGTKCTGFEATVPSCSPSSGTPITILGWAHGDLSLNQIPAWSTSGNCGVA